MKTNTDHLKPTVRIRVATSNFYIGPIAIAIKPLGKIAEIQRLVELRTVGTNEKTRAYLTATDLSSPTKFRCRLLSLGNYTFGGGERELVWLQERLAQSKWGAIDKPEKPDQTVIILTGELCTGKT